MGPSDHRRHGTPVAGYPATLLANPTYDSVTCYHIHGKTTACELLSLPRQDHRKQCTYPTARPPQAPGKTTGLLASARPPSPGFMAYVWWRL